MVFMDVGAGLTQLRLEVVDALLGGDHARLVPDFPLAISSCSARSNFARSSAGDSGSAGETERSEKLGVMRSSFRLGFGLPWTG